MTCGRTFPPNTGTCPNDGTVLQVQYPDPLIGMVLPRHYRITDKLGRGAMSVVYTGVYEPLNQPVAIKMLKAHLVSDLQTFKRFQQEAKTAGALEHPNIVAIFDFGVTDQGVPYLVMELVKGESLFKLLRLHHPFPVSAAMTIFNQTADALEYTHQRGVVHRDIKPSNILVQNFGTGEESVKIVDFGIAKLQNYEGNPSANLTQTGEVFGTPLYISPEQAMAKPLDLRSDIYSFGCVMYETLAGKPPFNAATAFEVLGLQCTAKHSSIYLSRSSSELPPSLVAAVDRCLEKMPDDRYQSMQELALDLQKAEREQSLIVRSASATAEHMQLGGLLDNRSAEPQSESAKGASGSDFTHKMQPSDLRPRQVPMRASADARRSGDYATLEQQKQRARKAASPYIAFAISSLAGCVSGLIYLFTVHSPSPVVTTERTDPIEHATAGIMERSEGFDPAIGALREKALDEYDNKDYQQAQDNIIKALSLARDKHDTVAAGLLLADQCMIYISMKKIQDALDSGTAAVKILEENPSVRKKDLSFALRALGIASYWDNDLGQAEQLLQRSVGIDEQVYGRDDERYAIGVARLAKVFQAEKKYDDAEKNYRQALAISQSCHRPGDGHLVMRMRALGDFLRSRHRQGEAQALEEQAKQLEAQEEPAAPAAPAN